MYILGGDQTIAMQVVADTPTEQRMSAAYAAGVVSAATAPARRSSRSHDRRLHRRQRPGEWLEQGSVDLWLRQTPGHRGLSFGLSNVLLDQHVYQRGRIGRLINAAWETGLLGVGADADTGRDNRR